jgi:hypothetical protein
MATTHQHLSRVLDAQAAQIIAVVNQAQRPRNHSEYNSEDTIATFNAWPVSSRPGLVQAGLSHWASHTPPRLIIGPLNRLCSTCLCAETPNVRCSDLVSWSFSALPQQIDSTNSSSSGTSSTPLAVAPYIGTARRLLPTPRFNRGSL